MLHRLRAMEGLYPGLGIMILSDHSPAFFSPLSPPCFCLFQVLLQESER